MFMARGPDDAGREIKIKREEKETVDPPQPRCERTTEGKKLVRGSRSRAVNVSSG
jgi:hypothetical protein